MVGTTAPCPNATEAAHYGGGRGVVADHDAIRELVSTEDDTLAATEELTATVADRVRDGLARVRREPAALTLGVAIAVWVFVFARLVVLRHDRFYTADFDLGINDQAIWLLAHGKSFDTVRGLPVFGHHATFGYFLLVPLQWLGGGANTWDVLQVAVLGSSAVPIAILAHRRLGRPWIATVLGLVWLLQPSVQYFAWETFHPEVIALAFLLWAYLALDAKRWKAAAILIFLALIWKEDIALFIVGLGGLYAIRRQWRVAGALVASGLAWFAFTAMWLVPHEAGGATVYGALYGNLGDTPGQVFINSIRHPSRAIGRFIDNDAVGYGRDLNVPFSFSPLAAPEVLITGLPQAAINALTRAAFTTDIRYHYQALPLLALGLGMVEGIARLVRWRPRSLTGVVGVVAAVAFATTVGWGPSPVGVRYHGGYWPLRTGAELPARRAAIALVSDDRGVAADFAMVPHLTHRDVIYTYPNPWNNLNFGIRPTDHGDPAKVHWLVLNEGFLNASGKALYASLLDDGEFVERFNKAGVVVAERVKFANG